MIVPRPLLLALPFALASCHIHAGRDHFVVDGVRLDAKHEETLTLETWPGEGLTIDSHQGDITVERGSGPTTLVLTVHERRLGEAHAHIENGRLVARTADGSTCAIGKVRLTASGPLAGLTLDPGLGDIELRDVEITGRLVADTGLGDVLVRAAGNPDAVELASGMGDISAHSFRCRRLEASTGMGDVDLDGMEADEAELSSGLGDVDVVRSSGKFLEADTGLGDVDLVESHFERRDLSTGLGSVDSR
jgi:DUF4097 and DUF4098 domain-containing protein YvlB